MGTNVGLWIDHRKAIIVFVDASGEKTRLMISDVEKQPRRSGDSPLKGAFERIKFANDINQKRKYMEHLGIYFDSVAACIKDADTILILGPGEAKNELKIRLEGKKIGNKIGGIEAAGKMTNRQLEVKVRKYFEK